MLATIHGIVISLRPLKRVLSGAQLQCLKNSLTFLMQEIQIAGQLHGYKLMHLKCIQNGLM